MVSNLIRIFEVLEPAHCTSLRLGKFGPNAAAVFGIRLFKRFDGVFSVICGMTSLVRTQIAVIYLILKSDFTRIPPKGEFVSSPMMKRTRLYASY